MSYRITLGEEAALAYAKLPPRLRQYLSAELRRLAENPIALSTPAHFPHAQDGQLFHPEKIMVDGLEHFFTVMFKYQQEAFIVVEWIVHQSR